MISGLALVTALTLIGQAREPAAVSDDRLAKASAGWSPLFNGRNLDGWYTFLQEHGKNSDPDRVVTIEGGAIHLYKHAAEGSKVVMGYICTQKEFGDYHLRFQYRWGEKKFEPRYKMKRDAGLYYHILGADAVWPRALQFQVEQTNVGDLIALHGLQLDTWVDPKTRGQAMLTFLGPEDGGVPNVLGGRNDGYQKHLAGEHEVDGWNTAEIIARGDTTTHVLNGKVMNRGKNVRLVDTEKGNASRPITRGRIAMEIEAAEIFFRNVEIKPLGEKSGDAEGR